MFKQMLPSMLSSASYASGIVFIRFAYSAGITPGMAAFLRFLIAVLALGAYLKLSNRWQPLPRPQITALLLLGFLAYTVLGVTWFVALNTTPAWLVSLFVAIIPLAVSLGSWLFLKEKFTPMQILALVMVVFGSVVIFWRPFEVSITLGVILMVFNILINAAYILIGERYIRGVPPVLAAFWMILGAAVGTLFYALAAGELSLAFETEGWLWISLFAFISTALAITFLWWGIRLLGPSRAVIVGSIEPVFSIILAVFILGERLDMVQILGASTILAGVVLVRFSR